MRSIGHELVSLLTVLSVPVAIAFVFPYDAVHFKPQRGLDSCESLAAFVSLTEDEQLTAMRSAKTAWQVDSDGVRRLRVDLSLGELPDDAAATFLDVGVVPSRSPASLVEYAPPAYPRTLAAPPAARLAKDEAAPVPQPPFPKSELLKLD